MRSADISPPTEEDRRRERAEAFNDLANAKIGGPPPMGLAEIEFTIRRAIEGDRKHQGSMAAALAKALTAKEKQNGRP